MSNRKPYKIIGTNTRIKVAGIPDVPAKVDTGATISSIWASQITLTPENKLEFCLFAPGSPLYTGERITVDEFKVRNVRNSTGHEEIRYLVWLPTVIKGKRIRTSYTLADRSRNDFPVLIGRRALNGKFLVNVSKACIRNRERPVNHNLNREFAANPQLFHQNRITKAHHVNRLIYTTHNDLSESFFRADGWRVVYYDQTNDPISLEPESLVYFRDPFNDPEYRPDPQHIDQLIAAHPNSYIIDQIASFQDLVNIEDKFLQSQKYPELYPKTWLPSDQAFVVGQHLAKPRISQRARDILFDPGDRELDDHWIIQELLDIQQELRVYIVGDEILPQASIKSSKSSGQVKVIGSRPLSCAERDFIRQIMPKTTLDFAGIDLAILTNGEYRLIEINRSPQFRRYAENTGLNLASLLSRLNQIRYIT